ncbi:MAG: hypothetical protein ACI4Q6_03995 [Huintestinicola sp.]
MQIAELMLVSLGETIVLELIFALICGIKTKKELWVNILCNTLTNPVVTFVYYLLSYGSGLSVHLLTVFLIFLEISAVIAEGCVYKKLTHINRPFLFSLGANLFSYFTGLMINNFLWEMLLLS